MRCPYVSQTSKFIDRIDRHIRAWIERSTYLTVATVDADRNMDVSPKGDPAGLQKFWMTRRSPSPTGRATIGTMGSKTSRKQAASGWFFSCRTAMRWFV
ncbi:pyridoxamine 5'-phosphate oxidase family protein [uncultured Tateyamaria sp.]|nr:pyridoxamine 5'-phosphate oxidase family protein [uncultured Tateyamaria sp.]